MSTSTPLTNLAKLVDAAQTFMDVANEQSTTTCPSDPCDYCTAGEALQSALMDAKDVLAIANLIPEKMVLQPEAFDLLVAMLDEDPKPDPKLVELFARPSRFV